MSWKRVGREMVRVFFAHNQHIAIVTGKKPRSCNEVELVEIGQNPKVPTFVVQCRCHHTSQHGHHQRPDSYCLVQPIFAGPKRQYLTLLHRDGSDLVKVESMSPSALDHSCTSAIGRDIESEDAEHSATIASAIGFSQNFSLDEAFKDALKKLRLPSSDPNQELSIIDVVSMGAAYGGFSGFSRLFVKIEQSRILNDPALRENPRKRMATVKHQVERPKKSNLHH